MSASDEIAMLRAKKSAVVVARLRGDLDYDKAKAMEADLDAALATTERTTALGGYEGEAEVNKNQPNREG